jgi:hypothetical protein
MAAEPLTPAGARRWTLAHPQQRLWNRALVAAIEAAFARALRVAALLVWLVMTVDTLMLLGRVVRPRLRLLGARSLDPRPRAGSPQFTAARGPLADVLNLDLRHQARRGRPLDGERHPVALGRRLRRLDLRGGR